MILQGHELADEILNNLLRQNTPRGKLVVIQVGADKSSQLYILQKRKLAEKLKVKFELINYAAVAKQQLIEKIQLLNGDDVVGGILVQLPLPQDINRDEVLGQIDPRKDVDGFRYILAKDDYRTLPPTVLAIDELLNFYKIKKYGQNILIVGGGFLVGRPLLKYWQSQNLDAEILGRDDKDYDEKLGSADLAVLATGGGRKFSHGDFKDGAVVIDASTVATDSKIGGDVESGTWPDSKSLAPVPGGVGPVTVAMLMKNLYQLSK